MRVGLVLAVVLALLAAPWDVTGELGRVLLFEGALPRLAVALFAGVSLGLLGAVMQAVLPNPFADPTVLGTSAGAQLAIVLATVFAPGLLAGGALRVALAGAAGATVLVLARRRRGSSRR